MYSYLHAPPISFSIILFSFSFIIAIIFSDVIYVPEGVWIAQLELLLGYWLDDRGIGIQLQERRDVALLHSIQTGPGAYPASCAVGAESKPAGV
jgi:hypothetical protein